jgi:hypothetical protein
VTGKFVLVTFGDPLSLILSAIAAVGTILLVIFGLPPFLQWLRSRHSALVPDERGPKESVLFDDSMQVEATGYEEVHFDFERDAKVRVFAREIYGQKFDFYLMDHRNFVRFCKDRRSSELVRRTDSSLVEFQRVIPRGGAWYFVVDAYGKQNDREVRVQVRTTPPS